MITVLTTGNILLFQEPDRVASDIILFYIHPAHVNQSRKHFSCMAELNHTSYTSRAMPVPTVMLGMGTCR